MKVKYDKSADAAFIRLSNKTPDGAIEIDEGLIVHTTQDNKIVAIEILDVSQKLSVRELFKFEVEKQGHN